MMRIDVFQALADPTRRALVEALRRGEQPVNDLVREVDVHQSGVSRRIAKIRKKLQRFRATQSRS